MSHTPTHTPTPWCYRKAAKHLHIEGTHAGYGRRIATVPYVGDSTGWTSAANAAHIVHCVNTHDALVEALRSSFATLNGLRDQKVAMPKWMQIHVTDSLNLANQALAQVEKGAEL